LSQKPQQAGTRASRNRHKEVNMHRLVAAFVYFLIVYACGFATGVVREFLVTPRTGLTLALWIELPVMVGASLFAARFVLHRFGVKDCPQDQLFLGVLGLGLLIVTEEVMSWALWGISVFTIWAHFSALAAIANFAGLLLFGLMPMLIGLCSGRKQNAEQL
jgi:hypothetical protein